MVEFDANRDRRQHPRVDLLAKLQGELVALDEEVHVTQLDVKGMRVEATTPLSTRLPHDFRIRDGSSSVLVRGRVAHNRVVLDGDRVTYVAGIEFIDPPPDALEVIRRFTETPGVLAE